MISQSAVLFATALAAVVSRAAPTGCSLADAQLVLPPAAASSGVTVPSGEKPVMVLLGRGAQNYTCTAGAYASNVAVANLWDASCGEWTSRAEVLCW